METTLDSVIKAYSGPFEQGGFTPAGVLWQSDAVMQMAHDKLLQILPPNRKAFSALDFGCGYGSLVPRLEQAGMHQYVGVDITPVILQACRARYPHYRFTPSLEGTMEVDYGFVCGTFNLKAEVPDSEWARMVRSSLRKLDRMCRKGLAFNCFSPTPDWKREQLWYPASMNELLSCVSGDVEVLQGYGPDGHDIKQVTVLVHKQ